MVSVTQTEFKELKQLQAVLDFEIERIKGSLESGSVEDFINQF